MPKELLPSLRKNLQKQKKPNLPPKNPRQVNPSQKKPRTPQGQAEAFETLSLNLLSGITDTKATPKRLQNSIKRFRNFIIGISLLFSLLLIVNQLLDIKIDQLKNEQDVLNLRVLRYFQIEQESKNIHNRTNYYKQKQSEKQKIMDKTSFVMEHIKTNTNLEHLQIENSKFGLSAKGASPLVFTRLIADYLSGDAVSEIVLKSASLNSRDGTFRIEMEGVFTK